ncbi:uncharacterized protein [Diadema setosum]|uniref:uncharacterized protein n=1 Tax=Diadema setosum TaxID=31175 RepID=UPI003B3AC617
MTSKKITPPSTSELGLTMRLSYNLLPDVHDDAINEELLEALRQGLQDVSRQRLRFVLISFRRQANQENCLALRDVINILSENKVKFKTRTLKLLQMKFEKKHGLDYEALWKLMVEAQSRTGRDSVQATYGKRDQLDASGSHLSSAISDARDVELLTKLNKILQTSDGFDLKEMRAVCKSSDVSQHGLIPKKRFRKICSDQCLPVSGVLLSTLLSRCDDEKNGQISWPEFMTLLERAVGLDKSLSTSQQGRPKSVASSQQGVTLTSSLNISKAGAETSKAISSATGKDDKDKNLLKKQKNVSFEHSKGSLPSKASKPVVSNAAIMGDDQTEKDFLRSEYRRISGDAAMSKPSATEGLRQEATLDLATETKQNPDKGSTVAETKPTANSLAMSLPSPPTQSPAVPKKQTKTAWSRTQSARPKTASSRPASRATPRGVKKTKVAESVGKTSPKRSNSNLGASKGREKVTTPEKRPSQQTSPGSEKESCPREESKETDSLNQSNTSTTSTAVTVANSDGLKDIDSQSGSVDTGQGGAPGSTAPTENIPQGLMALGTGQEEATPSDASLQKSASSPSIASTQISQLSQDSDSHASSQGESNVSAVSSQISQDSNSHNSIPASDQPLLSSKQQTGGDTRSILSFVSSVGGGSGGEEKRKGMGSSLMRSFKSLLKRGKKGEGKEEEEEEEEELEEMEMDGEEEELMRLGGSRDGKDIVEEIEEEVAESAQPGQEDKEKKEEEEEKETDVEGSVTLDVVVQGKEVRYYRPDAYRQTQMVPDPPSVELQLDWVYGYRGNDCRGNLFEVSGGEEILYFMSSIAIMYNPTLNLQRHYTKHTAEIRSVTVHSDGVTVASGQSRGPDASGVKASIHIWRVDTLETSVIIEEGFDAVICLAFSPHQDHLLAVDKSNKHTLSVWNYKSGEKAASALMNTSVVCQAAFHPKDQHQIISVGREHFVFWKLSKESEEGAFQLEQSMMGNYETSMKAKYVISMAFRSNGDLITGDSNGTLYVWPSGGNTISHTISHVHEGPVFSLQTIGSVIVSGGRDGVLQCWTLAGKGGDHHGKLQIPKEEGGIRCILHSGSNVYVGTTVNSLLRIALKDTKFAITGDESTSCLTQSHYEEVHCLTVLPGDRFITGSYDGTVSLCSLADHRPLWRHAVKGTNIHCMDVHSDSDLVAVGTKDAKMGDSLVILSVGQSNEEPEVNRYKLGKGTAMCLKISPDGELIAIGCQDNLILVLKTSDKGHTLEEVGKFSGHSGPIIGLDWSREKLAAESGYLLQSCSDQLDYMIWSSQTFEAVSGQEVRNVEWSSQQCLMGFPVAGIWGKEVEGPMHSSVDVSREGSPLVAAGSSDGQVALFRAPCGHSEAQSKQFVAHPHCSVCVRFASALGQCLLTAGSKDYTVCQWKVASCE